MIQHHALTNEGLYCVETETLTHWGSLVLQNANHIKERLNNNEFKEHNEVFSIFWETVYGVFTGDIKTWEPVIEMAFSELSYIPFIPMKINNTWFNAVIIETDLDRTDEPIKNGTAAPILLSFIDLLESSKRGLIAKTCANPDCQNLFLAKKTNVKYCQNCQQNYKSIHDKRRSATTRGKHKQYCEYLSHNKDIFSQEFEFDFRNESNFYWYKLSGKEVTSEERYTGNILTEEEYSRWLDQQHKKHKEIAKEERRLARLESPS